MPNFDINSAMGIMGGNPKQFLQMQMNKNPQIAQFSTQLVNMQKSSGMNDKDFALQYVRQNGIPEEAFMKLANRLGLK